MGHTHNSIWIKADIDWVFGVTNDIDRWKDLFSEYKESTVVKREGNKLTFRLTTYAEGERPSRTWVSERIIDKENYKCDAQRLEPKYPFEYMNIHWEYKEKEGGTDLIWVQDFKTAADCPWNDGKMENFLNKNSKIQMQIIKEKIESGFGAEY